MHHDQSFVPLGPIIATEGTVRVYAFVPGDAAHPEALQALEAFTARGDRTRIRDYRGYTIVRHVGEILARDDDGTPRSITHLDHADLRDATLEGDFEGIDFSGSDLRGANLRRADLRRATVSISAAVSVLGLAWEVDTGHAGVFRLVESPHAPVAFERSDATDEHTLWPGQVFTIDLVRTDGAATPPPSRGTTALGVGR